jgi:hypothetical protein
MEIITPKNKTKVTVEEAFRAFRGGKRILAVLSDDGKIYAAHVFDKQLHNSLYEINLYELGEYLAEGEWYVLNDEKIIDVTFTSVWDFSDRVVTRAKYNPSTGRVFDIETVDDPTVEGTCTREFITLPDGTELDVEYDPSDEYDGPYVVMRDDADGEED